MDALTVKRIQNMHPVVRQPLQATYKELSERMPSGHRIRFSHCSRTFEEQDKLYLQKPKVTNAKAGYSFHNYGLAFDIVLLIDKDGNGTYETVSWDSSREAWLIATRFLESRGWVNGFISNGKKWDLPHFQKTYGYTCKQLLKMINTPGQYTEEVVDNVKYKYPKIAA